MHIVHGCNITIHLRNALDTLRHCARMPVGDVCCVMSVSVIAGGDGAIYIHMWPIYVYIYTVTYSHSAV